MLTPVVIGASLARSVSRFIPNCSSLREWQLPRELRPIIFFDKCSNSSRPPSASSTILPVPAVPRMRLSFSRGSAISHVRAFDRPSWSLQSLFAAPLRALTDAEIAHLLSLAQLHVPPAEMQPLKMHLQQLLAFLETVKAADAGGCPPMHALPCNPVLACLDACDAASDDAVLEAVLWNSSWQQESMFAVPKAIDD